MLQSFLPKDVNVSVTVDDTRLRSNLILNKTLKLTNNAFFYTILGFTQSNSRPLTTPVVFILKNPGPCLSGIHLNITGIENVEVKCDCFDGSNLHAFREYNLFSFALCKSLHKKVKRI